jgi:hypothetical protein
MANALLSIRILGVRRLGHDFQPIEDWRARSGGQGDGQNSTGSGRLKLPDDGRVSLSGFPQHVEGLQYGCLPDGHVEHALADFDRFQLAKCSRRRHTLSRDMPAVLISSSIGRRRKDAATDAGVSAPNIGVVSVLTRQTLTLL